MQDYSNLKKNIKLFFFSFIQFIILIILIIFSIKVFTSEYLNHIINENLPIKIQEERAIWLLSISSFIVLFFFNFYLFINLKIFEKKIFNFTLPILGFIYWTYFLFKIFKMKILNKYLINTYKEESSFKLFIYKNAKNEKEKKIIIQNTTFTIFQTLISLTGFLIMILTKEEENNDPSGSIFLNTFSYFTEWSNIITLIFMMCLIITGYRFFFKNNSFVLATISYVSITCITFVLAFFFMIILYHTPFNNPFNTTKSIWFHFINPICFILFSSYLLKRTKLDITKSNSYIIHAAIVPSIYGIYVYSLPFFTNVSIYGFVTNLNENIIPYYGNPDSNFYNGGWQSIFCLIGIIILFFTVIYLSRFLLIRDLNKWKEINK